MLKFDRQTKSNLFFVFAALLATAFIFRNSFQNGDVSNAWSRGISEWLRKLVDPNSHFKPASFHAFIRKTAHCIEFCILGLSLTGFMTGLKLQTGKLHFFMVLFFVLAVAVSDEFIQSFTGRTSSVRDIIIDFCGATAGVLLGLVCFLLQKHHASRQLLPPSSSQPS